MLTADTADGVRLGVIGLLPDSAVPAQRTESRHFVAAELFFSRLLRTPPSHRPIVVARRHPAIELDVNAVVLAQTPTERLMPVLRAASPLITSVTLRDVYVDQRLPAGDRVLTVRLAVAPRDEAGGARRL
ncbi:hypothetical protein ACWCQZ_41495 [Streptomyces sp. NPDC002285]